MKEAEPNNKVLLGMSGGTDSSVAALLLQDAGYEVTGITFRFYEKEMIQSIWRMPALYVNVWASPISHTMFVVPSGKPSLTISSTNIWQVIPRFPVLYATTT